MPSNPTIGIIPNNGVWGYTAQTPATYDESTLTPDSVSATSIATDTIWDGENTFVVGAGPDSAEEISLAEAKKRLLERTNPSAPLIIDENTEINFDDYDVLDLVLGANAPEIEFTCTAPPAGFIRSCLVILRHDDATVYTNPTFPNITRWDVLNIAPVLPTNAGAMISFWIFTHDGSSFWGLAGTETPTTHILTFSLSDGGVHLPDGTAGNAAATKVTNYDNTGTKTTNACNPGMTVYSFDKSTDQHLMIDFVVPYNYVSGGTVRMWPTTAVTSGNIVMKSAFARVPTTTNFLTANTLFDAVQISGVVAVGDAAGKPVELTMTTIGGSAGATNLTPNQKVILMIGRDADNVSDTADGLVYLSGFQFEYIGNL